MQDYAPLICQALKRGSLCCSVVQSWFVESLIVLGVDGEVRCVDIVSLHYHIEDLRLMHCSFLHEIDNLVLYNLALVYIVIKLDLEFVLQLSVLLEEVFILNWIGEVLVVLCQQVDFIVVGP